MIRTAILKEDIEKIRDDTTIEKVRIFIMDKHTWKVEPIHSGNDFPKKEKLFHRDAKEGK